MRFLQEVQADALTMAQARQAEPLVGQVLAGVISGVQSYGFFVEVPPSQVEGLVHVSSLKDDWYEYRARQNRLVGRKNRRTYMLGDAVEVEIQKVDALRHQIDLAVVLPEEEGEDAAAHRPVEPPPEEADEARTRPEPVGLPVVLGVSGASAQPLAERALQLLLEAGETVEMITSRGAIGVWQAELGLRVPSEPDAQEQFWRERTGCGGGSLRCHRWNDQAAAIASGSYRTRGMVILPASMGTVGRIASGVALDLIERAADVHLKEGPAPGDRAAGNPLEPGAPAQPHGPGGGGGPHRPARSGLVPPAHHPGRDGRLPGDPGVRRARL